MELDGTITGGSNAYLIPDYGPLTLTGPSSSVGNFYDDDNGSTVVVDGSLNATNEFYVESNAATEIDGTLTTAYGVIYGTLSGTGTVTAPNGVIYVYGQVAPGTASGPGTLTVGNLDFQGGSSLDAQLAGASSYSVLQVAAGDTLTLSGGILSVSLLNGFTPSEGQQFQIVSAGGGTISGTFAGLPDGSAVLSGSSLFAVNYDANDDVTLTTLSADIWSGGGSSNTNWSDPDNWVNGVGPPDRRQPDLPGSQYGAEPDKRLFRRYFGSIAISGSNYTFSGNA